jgi:hypothetical protein
LGLPDRNKYLFVFEKIDAVMARIAADFKI